MAYATILRRCCGARGSGLYAVANIVSFSNYAKPKDNYLGNAWIENDFLKAK
ncbi:MAG: hypothetical protein R3F37_00055 [Candidatus Competibacteraceae bacterium]